MNYTCLHGAGSIRTDFFRFVRFNPPYLPNQRSIRLLSDSLLANLEQVALAKNLLRVPLEVNETVFDYVRNLT